MKNICFNPIHNLLLKIIYTIFQYQLLKSTVQNLLEFHDIGKARSM